MVKYAALFRLPQLEACFALVSLDIKELFTQNLVGADDDIAFGQRLWRDIVAFGGGCDAWVHLGIKYGTCTLQNYSTIQ